MNDRWLDGAGKAPALSEIEWLKKQFRDHFDHNLPPPNLFPTPEGNIEGEWSFTSKAVILHINMSNHRAEYLSFNKQDDNNDAEQTLNLDNPASWQQLNNLIKALTHHQNTSPALS